MAISGSYDQSIIIWNLNDQSMETLNGCNSNVYGVALSKENDFVVSGSGDNCVGIWDLGTKEVSKIPGHIEQIVGGGVDEENNLAVTMSNDKTIRCWDLKRKCQTHVTAGKAYSINSIKITPDNRLIISACDDNTLKIWVLYNFLYLTSLNSHTDRVICLSISNDSTFCISGSQDSTLILLTFSQIKILKGHKSTVRAVVIYNNNKNVASGSFDQKIII